MVSMHQVKQTMQFALVICVVLAVPGLSFGDQRVFTDSFMIGQCQFSTTGSNPFFILQPGYELILEGQELKTNVRLVITVLADTRIVNGVKTRVVEERETHDGALVEARGTSSRSVPLRTRCSTS